MDAGTRVCGVAPGPCYPGIVDAGLIGKLLIAVGLLIAAAGLVLALGGRLPLGRLPGDISFSRGNVSFSFPIVTCVVLSLLLTAVLAVISRR